MPDDSTLPINPDLAGRARSGADQVDGIQYLITGMLVTYMRQQFARNDSRQLLNPQMSKLLWSTDQSQLTINIDDATTWDPNKTGQRPSIMVLEGDYNWEQLSINDQDIMKTTMAKIGAENLIAARSGTHEVSVIAAAAQVGMIASQLEFDLWAFLKTVIQKEAPNTFLRCSMGATTRRQRLRSGDKPTGITVYGVKIQLQFRYLQRMSIFQQTALLNRIHLEQSSQ